MATEMTTQDNGNEQVSNMSARLTIVLDEAHGIRAALFRLASMMQQDDEYGMGYLMKSLANTLEQQLTDLENIEVALRDLEVSA